MSSTESLKASDLYHILIPVLRYTLFLYQFQIGSKERWYRWPLISTVHFSRCDVCSEWRIQCMLVNHDDIKKKLHTSLPWSWIYSNLPVTTVGNKNSIITFVNLTMSCKNISRLGIITCSLYTRDNSMLFYFIYVHVLWLRIKSTIYDNISLFFFNPEISKKNEKLLTF
jgi:hypothetical protein